MGADAEYEALLDALAAEQLGLQSELRELEEDDWFRPTPSKGWDVRDTVSHLADTDQVGMDTCIGGARPLNEWGPTLASSEDVTLWGVLAGRRRTGAAVLAWWEDTSSREREEVNAVLGTDLADTEVLDALRPLGIAVEGSGDDIVAVAPTFRPDLEREADVVEEVARTVGFDSIGRTVPRPREQVGGLSRAQRERRTVADALVGAGFSEAVTLPLVAPADLALAGAPLDRVVEAANPLRAEESVLRTRIVPGLLRAVARNRVHGIGDVALFETGHVFLAPTDGAVLPDEPLHLALAAAGTWQRRPVENDRAVDAYDATDALRHVFAALELADARFEGAEHDGFHPTRAATVLVDGVPVGVVGEVAGGVLDALELAPPVVAAEVDLDALLGARRRDRTFRPPSPYPPSSIDLAFVVGERVESEAVAATLRTAAGDLLEDLRLFDVFRSDALGAGRKSVAFALRFRAADRTLTDAEVGEVRQRGIDAVVREHEAELRA